VEELQRLVCAVNKTFICGCQLPANERLARLRHGLIFLGHDPVVQLQHDLIRRVSIGNQIIDFGLCVCTRKML